MASTATRPPFTAAERKLLTDRLIAAVLWQRDFARRGWTQAAANELEEAIRLAEDLDENA